MKIIKMLCTQSDCYKVGRKISPKGLMLHSVGCSQPNPYVFQRIWNKARVNACVHAVLGPDGTVLQCLEWNRRGWHAGGAANNTHIGIEMTEPATIKYIGGSNWKDLDPVKTKAHVLATYKTAVELFAKLCKDYKLDPLKDGVILSHSEGHKRGVASNHGDVEHIWSRFGLTMNGFRNDVKKAIYTVVVKSVASVSKPVQPTVKPLGYLVKVTAWFLNYRTGPGVNYKKRGSIRKNQVYTIVDEKYGWGKLKSGAGWINLKYVNRV